MKRLLIALLCLSPLGASSANPYWEAYARTWGPYWVSLIHDLRGTAEAGECASTTADGDRDSNAEGMPHLIIVDYDEFAHVSVIFDLGSQDEGSSILYGFPHFGVFFRWYDALFGTGDSEVQSEETVDSLES